MIYLLKSLTRLRNFYRGIQTLAEFSCKVSKTRDEDLTFFPMVQDPAQLERKNLDPAPTFNRNEEKNTFIF